MSLLGPVELPTTNSGRPAQASMAFAAKRIASGLVQLTCVFRQEVGGSEKNIKQVKDREKVRPREKCYPSSSRRLLASLLLLYRGNTRLSLMDMVAVLHATR